MRKQIPRAALTLLGTLLAVNVYRAATQSITIDEAYNYNLYLAGPLKEIFNLYDANNHVLYTLLARASVYLMGTSELALRLPSVFGGAIFFGALFLLCRRLFGDGWVMLLAVAVVSLNPYVLDFLSAARGYGLALGLLFAGIVALSGGSPWTAGVAFGLSVAANLTMAFPVAAAVFVFGTRFLRERRFVDELLLPAVVVAGLFLVIPLSNARPDQFYYGAKSLLETSESLVYGAFIHRSDGGFLGDMERFALEARFLAQRVAPAVTVILAIGALFWRDRIAATFILTLGLVIATHASAQVPYPLGRTGLHLLILALLGVVALIPLLWRRRATRPAAVLPAAAMILATAVFIIRWNVRVYSDWTFNAATREIVETIAVDRARRGLAAVTVGGSWLFEPGLNYYRHARKLEWMKPVVRGDAAGAFDYYVLTPEDKAVVERHSLHRLFTDSRSGVVLATRYTEQTAMKLSDGKIQHLNGVSNDKGIIAAAAMDQRGSLQKSIASGKNVDRKDVSGAMMREFKTAVARVLTPHATAILLDPEYGLDAARARAPRCGLLLAYEMSGYDNTKPGRLPDLLPNVSARRLLELGANAVKVLLYYTPFEDSEINNIKHAFIERIGAECEALQIPFFLEFVGYDPAGGEEKGLEYAKRKPEIVRKSMEEFSKARYGVDVLKVEVPINATYVEGSVVYKGQKAYSRAEALEHFRAAAAVATRPFIYLSAGVSNEQFVESLTMAGESGADFSGVLCGRATWKEGIPVYAAKGAKALEDWLAGEGVKNINAVNNAIRSARPWQAKLGLPAPAAV